MEKERGRDREMACKSEVIIWFSSLKANLLVQFSETTEAQFGTQSMSFMQVARDPLPLVSSVWKPEAGDGTIN